VANWLQTAKTAGQSARTTNSSLVAIKGFSRWLVSDRSAPDDPLAHLRQGNEETDIRVERRAPTAEELQRVVQAAWKSSRIFRKLSGSDRAMLYTTAAYTGLRASELASLTEASLDLEGDPPTIIVQAGYSKHRRKDIQPIPSWLAGRLREWLGDRPAKSEEPVAAVPIRPAAGSAKLWPGSWVQGRAAEMLRIDLDAARAAWLDETEADAEERSRRERSDFLQERDNAGRVFDFHALRHGFISSLVAAGVHPKVAQELARHGTISLILDRYTHLKLAGVIQALELLPELPMSPTGDAARATGTDRVAPDFPVQPDRP